MSNTALLIIDVQNCMFNPQWPVHNGAKLLSTLGTLIDQARTADVPVIYVQHCGRPGDPHEPGSLGWEIHPEVTPRSGELVIQKTEPDAFFETALKNELEAQGIENLVMAGIQTDYCVDTTCRRAFSEGYKTVLVADGHSTWGQNDLTADQIIAHHNTVLGDWFATLQKAKEVVL